jgi:hypothetical protein
MAKVSKNKMRNVDVVKESLLRGRISRCFWDGYYLESHTKNLWFTSSDCYGGGKLVNYGTVLLQWNREHTEVYLNTTRYSNTTSKIQYLIRRYIETLPEDVKVYNVCGLGMGVHNIIQPDNYYKSKTYKVEEYDRH